MKKTFEQLFITYRRLTTYCCDNKSIGIFILTVITLAVYHKSLNNQFITNWDDYEYVFKNPDIRGFNLEHIRAAFTKFYVGNYAPLHIISYMADYAVWGLNPAGYIGTNLALHLLNGMLFYLIINRLFQNSRLAFLSAFIFLMHPVQVESVVWISQRKTVLAMFFFLLSFLFYVLHRGTKSNTGLAYYFISLTMFVCALLTKSVVIILPIALLLYDFSFLSPGNRRHCMINKVPFIIAATILTIVAFKSHANEAGGGIESVYPGGTPFATLFTMLTIFVKYAKLLLWPTNLSSDYDPVIRTDIDWDVALSGVIVGLFFYLLYHLYRKDKKLFFWASLLPIGLIPVAQIVPLVTLMNDRYLYFPLLGVAVIISQGLLACSEKLSRPGKWVEFVVITMLLLPLTFFSWQRTLVWHDAVSLWSDAFLKSHHYFTSSQLGTALYQANRIDEAIVAYENALSMEPPSDLLQLCRFGVINLKNGDYASAVYYLERCDKSFSESALTRNLLNIAIKKKIEGTAMLGRLGE